MFRIAARRLPLQQRCIHTAPAQAARLTQRRRIVFAGAAAVAFTYFAWRISPGNRIALDSHTAPATRNTPPPPPPPPQQQQQQQQDDGKPQEEPKTSPSSIDDVSEEEGEDKGPDAANSAAYNPDTGEINWDCPCLGGMAHGPCGMQFREAFSCFVHSEDEPKGIDCVEKFKAMQDCFREHPDVYGEDIVDDDDEQNESENPQTLAEPEAVTITNEAAPETIDTSPKQSSKVDRS